MLTRKQQQLLIFIHERIQEEGISPSFDEMKDALDLKSKSGIHRLIGALEERGFLRRLPNRARALEVVKLPEGYGKQSAEPVAASVTSLKSSPASGGFRPRVIEGDLGRNHKPAALEPANDSFSVPVMGRIAAGVPISAIQDHTHSVSVPPEMIGSGEYFALEVNGDSMVEAGILDGDMVIIRQTPTAIPGDIVVALIDDEEATLKTWRKQGQSIALEAANPAYETRIFSADRVRVQGKLAGLVRKYD